ncbi:MAG: acyltransferase [Deltaproteobacteria bacterium]|nr:acyltransferase [Deltaproteobacteria bacterium]MBW2419442.1 acyltransferase [Deltaproteobacteria bacterium]
MSRLKLPFHPALDGVRGIALPGMLIFHADPAWLPGGFLSLSTFFTLSGFLITGLLVVEREGTGSIAMPRFWSRRLRRLMPASVVALLGIAIGAAFFADSFQMARLRGDGLASLFYFSNWWFIFTGASYDGLVGSPSAYQHFWSLSVEEQYYFVYPLCTLAFLGLVSGSRRAFAALLLVATALSWSWMAWLAGTDVPTSRIYYGTDTRCGEILMGGVLALLLAGRDPLPRGPLRNLVLAAGVLGLTIGGYAWWTASIEAPELYRGGIVLYTFSTLAVIAAAVQTGGPTRAFLATPLLRWFGRISYGAYLYHWPIFIWLDFERTGLTQVPLAIVRIGLTLALAHASLKLLEEPIRRGHRIVSWRRWFAPAAAVGAVAAALVIVSPGQSSVPAAAEPALAASSGQARPPHERMRIAVLGDSLAFDIADGLTLWSKRDGRAKIWNAAIRGCGVARGAWPGGPGRQRGNCDSWPLRAEIWLEEFRPEVVVVLSGGWDIRWRELPEWGGKRLIGDPVFDEWLYGQYNELLDFFRDYDVPIVWLTTPCRVSPMGLTTGHFDPKRTRHLNDHIVSRLGEERAGEMLLVDLDAELCPGGEYTRSLHGIEDFRRDGIHLSKAAKLWVGTWLGEQLLAMEARGERRAAGIVER